MEELKFLLSLPPVKKPVVKETPPENPLTDSQQVKETDEEKLKVLQQNLTQLIAKTTAMPFRYIRNSYNCFYCTDSFDEPDNLRRHSKQHSDAEKKEAVLNNMDTKVYIDASKIECNLCSFVIDDMHKIMDHLICEHMVYFNKDVKMPLQPFKLHSLKVQCCECTASFQTFSYLLVHMNKEHTSREEKNMCESCGSFFQTAHHLRIHKRKKHPKTDIKCSECGEVVPNTDYLRTHMQNYHEKKLKCFYCDEMLDTHYKRTMHMLTQHKIRDKISCPHCPKTFIFRSSMKRHLRETHLQEKNVVCKICGWKAFEHNRLQKHMVKHTNERNHKCPRCEKKFKSKKTMRQHFQNIHLKGSRYGVPEHRNIGKLASYELQTKLPSF